MEANINIAKTA